MESTKPGGETGPCGGGGKNDWIDANLSAKPKQVKTLFYCRCEALELLLQQRAGAVLLDAAEHCRIRRMLGVSRRELDSVVDHLAIDGSVFLLPLAGGVGIVARAAVFGGGE